MNYLTGKTFKEIVAEKVAQYKDGINTRLDDEHAWSLFHDEHTQIQTH
jgi:hypothetical protein